MSSATADTNIYISGLQFGGIPQRFLDSAAEGDFRLDVSDAILSETLRILRNKFRWTPQASREAEQDIRSYTNSAPPLRRWTLFRPILPITASLSAPPPLKAIILSQATRAIYFPSVIMTAFPS